jgi:hypothetical protein
MQLLVTIRIPLPDRKADIDRLVYNVKDLIRIKRSWSLKSYQVVNDDGTSVQELQEKSPLN